MNNLKIIYKNFLSLVSSNIISQFLSFFIAIYIGNCLIPEEYGVYNFIISLSMYFWMIGDLGTSLFAVKYITNAKDNEEAINKVFTIKCLLALISVCFYLLTINFLDTKYLDMFLYSPVIFFSSISIDYVYMSKNNMKYIGFAQLIRNSIILLLILLLNNSQYQLVAIISSYTIGYLIAYIYQYKKYSDTYTKLTLIKVHRNDLIEIVKNSFPFAISLFMVQINNNFDILYLKFFTDDYVVGIYSAAYKIINFLIAFLTIYTNSSYSVLSNKDIDIFELKKIFNSIFKAGMIFIIPITIGGIVLSQKIILLFYSEKYIESKYAFQLLICLVFIRMITSSMGSVLIMRGKEKSFASSVIIGAILNIFLNILLIDNLSYIGAAIATLIAETIQGFFIKKHFNKFMGSLNLIKPCIKPIIAGIIMGGILIYVDVNLVLSIILGGIIYFLTLMILNLKYIIVFIGDRYEKNDSLFKRN